MPLDFDTRVGAYCVVVDHGRMLLAHVREGWFGADLGWTLPGGGMEPNETPEETARREMREEAGLDVELSGLLAVDSFTVQPHERLNPDDRNRALVSLRIIYSARVTGGQLRNEPDGSTDKAEWIPLDTISGILRVELVDVAVTAYKTAADNCPV